MAIVGYNIYRNGVKQNTSLVETTQYLITGLTSNTNIGDITVKSVDDQGRESQSSLQIPSFLTKPAQVQNVVATVNSSNEIGLTWDAVSGDGTVGYNVLRGTTTGNLTPIDLGGLTPSFIDSVNPDTQYFYAIEAENATGKGELSLEVSGTTLEVNPNTPITLVDPTIVHFAIIGQSQADGFLSEPALTTESRPNTFTLSPNSNGRLSNTSTGTLIPMAELNQSGQVGETIGTSMAQLISYYANNSNLDVVVTNHSLNATTIQDLSKGGSSGKYEEAIAAATRVKAIADADNKNYQVHLIFYHGGSGNNPYDSALDTLKSDFRSDVSGLTTTSVNVFSDQMRLIGSPDYSIQMFNNYSGDSLSHITHSRYNLEYTGDNVHLTNHGSRHSAQYYARGIFETLFGSGFNVLQLGNNIVFENNKIVIPILNTEGILEGSGDYGLEVYNSTDTVTLSGSSIISGNTIVFTPASIPTGSKLIEVRSKQGASGELYSVSTDTTIFLNSSSQPYNLDKYLARHTVGKTIEFSIPEVTQTILLDHNETGSSLGSSWNSLQGFAHTGAADRSNLTNTLGDATGINVVFNQATWIPLNGISTAGQFGATTTTNSGAYPDAAIEGYHFSDNAGGTASYKLTNLNSNKIYDIKLLGSRSGTGTRRTTYTINGQSIEISVMGNTSNVAEFLDVAPDVNNEIEISLTDTGDLTFAYINVTEIYEHDSVATGIAPSGVTMSSTSIDENNSINDQVGTFGTNGTEPVTYSLSGTDASSFDIINTNQLVALESFDFETKSSYLITVTATNSQGSFAQDFTITINNITEGTGTTSQSQLNLIAINTVSDGSTTNPNGYIEYLPQNYETRNDWPIWIHYPGGGETGDGSIASLQNKILNKQIMNRLNNGLELDFIVLAPISTSAEFGNGQMQQNMDWNLSKYAGKFNPLQVHITVISGTGASGLTDWLNNNPASAQAINSIGYLSSNGLPQPAPDNQIYNTIDNNNIRTWFHHGDADGLVSLASRITYFDRIHSVFQNTDTDIHRFTGYVGVGHTAWNLIYSGQGKTTTQLSGAIDAGRPIIGNYYPWVDPETYYDWMLEQVPAKGSFALSVNNPSENQQVDITSNMIYEESFEWNFGDGTAVNTIDRNPSHIYTTQGVYTITLTLTNRFNEQTVITQEVTVITANLAEVQRAKLDFSSTRSPIDNTWNAINEATPSSANLVNSSGVTTGWGFALLANAIAVVDGTFNGGVITGDNSGIYPDDAMLGQFIFIVDGATVDFEVTSLDPTKVYEFRFFGNDDNFGSSPKTTTWTINGAVAQIDDIRVNFTNQAIIENVIPDAQGRVQIGISETGGGTSAYMNVMEVIELEEAVIEPSTREINVIPNGSETLSDGVTANPYGFVVYYPEGYNLSNDWDVLVWYPGGGETGDGSQANLEAEILTGNNQIMPWLNAGNDFPMVVVCPISPFGQFTGSGNAGRDIFLWIYDWLFNKTAVNGGKFHIQVLSGSGAFPTKWLQNGDPDFDKVDTLTLSAPDTIPSEPYFTNLIAAKTRVWYHHATNDSLVGITARRNSYSLIHDVYPKINYDRYRFTEYTTGGHNAWTRLYSNGGSTATKVTGSMPITNSFLDYYNWVSPETWAGWMMADTAATDILLPGTTINEGEPINTVISEITSDKLNPDVYTLVDGYGDNASFNISGNRTQSFLRNSEVFNFNTKSSYNIRLETFDGFTKDFIITVNDVVEVAPSLVTSPSVSGTPQVGETLTVVEGSYDGTLPINKTYSWEADGIEVSSSGTTYIPVSADTGKVITVVERAENNAGFLLTESAPTTAVLAAGAVDYSAEFAKRYDLSTTAAYDGSNNITGWNGLAVINTPVFVPAENAVRTKRANDDGFQYNAANETQPIELVWYLKLTESGSSPQWIATLSGDNGLRINGTGGINVYNSDVGLSIPFNEYVFVRVRLDGANSFVTVNNGTKMTFNTSGSFGSGAGNFGRRNSGGNSVDANWRFHGVALKLLDDQTMIDFRQHLIDIFA